MLELLEHSGLTGSQQQLVNAMRTCSQSLASMLNGEIEIPAANSKPAFAMTSQFDLVNKIEETLAMFMGWAARQSVQLGYCISADTPTMVSADGMRLQQVLNNLLSNAIKYAAGGTVMVSLSRSPAQPSMLQIDVADSGENPAAVQQGETRPLHQVHQPAAMNYRSSGMGLNISRSLVNAAGGCMEIFTRPAGGTCCRFSFPVTPVEQRSDMATARSILLQRQCVLVIAPVDIRESICCHLRRWGIQYIERESVVFCKDPELDRARFDTLILDLPSAGVAEQKKIQAIRHYWPAVPVAVVLPFTGKYDPRMNMGGVDVLHRPLTRSSLAAWLMACSLNRSSDTGAC